MLVLGHRGSPGFPRFGENTRTSFHRALDDGAHGIELDVRRCGDGSLVVIHDATIDRTTTGSGLVAGLHYDQLLRFDAGHGDTIPRLRSVLEEFGSHCVINVELKEAGMASEVAAMTSQLKADASVIISAFAIEDNDHDSNSDWLELTALGDRLATALLAHRNTIRRLGNEGLIDAVRIHHARGIHISRDAASPELIDLARRGNIALRVWTVNDPNEAVYWQTLGIDAIFSDRPGLCLKALAP